MPKIRLFVGGLSEKVDEQSLGSRLTHFGTVSGIDLKEKTDPEGNVVSRFSYVNIDAPSEKIDECIGLLNGSIWQGSCLRVEPAKESFLDRLSRERAAQQQNQQQCGFPEMTAKSPPPVTLAKEMKKHDGVKTMRLHRGDQEDNNESFKEEEKSKGKKKHKTFKSESIKSEIIMSEDIDHKKKKKEKRKSSPTKTEEPMFIKQKQKHKAEEEMMSAFKKCSSVWADSDSEINNDDTNDHKRKISHIDDKEDSSDQDFNDDVRLDKSASLASAKTYKQEKSKIENLRSLRNSKDNSEATVDNDTSDSHDFGDIRKEHQPQEEILANLEVSDGCSTTLKLKTAEDIASSNEGMPRYDPTLANQSSTQNKEIKQTAPSEAQTGNKYVKVSKVLNFKQNSSGFSFLARFSQQVKDKRDDTENEKLPVQVIVPPKPVIPAQLQVKKKPFFIHSDDPLIEDAIAWMAQSLTCEVEKEFIKIQPQLRSLYKIRSQRAMKESRFSRGRGRGQARGGRGIGRGAPY